MPKPVPLAPIKAYLSTSREGPPFEVSASLVVVVHGHFDGQVIPTDDPADVPGTTHQHLPCRMQRVQGRRMVSLRSGDRGHPRGKRPEWGFGQGALRLIS